MDADLRVCTNGQKCELIFDLKYEYKSININEHIIAVRRTSETIASLQKHIENKIIYYLKEKCKEAVIELEENIEVPVLFFDKSRELPNSTVLNSLIKSKKIYTMVVNEETYLVNINRPYIKLLTLPADIFVGMPMSYNKLIYECVSLHSSVWNWFISKDKMKWSEAGKGMRFVPKKEHLNHYVKLSIFPKGNNSGFGKKVEAISEKVVSNLPEISIECFEDRHKLTNEYLSGNKLRIVNYNILAEMYATKQNFPYCDSQFLSNDYRKVFMWKEVLGYHADIICLQEVGVNTFNSYLKKCCMKAGYDFVFNRKGNRLKEGLMILYRSKRFELVKLEHIVLCDYIKNKPELNKIVKDELPKTFFSIPTSLQYCVLKWKEKNTKFVVANTHLFYEEDAGLIRLLQVIAVVELLKKENLPIFLCGDFNSLPGTSSHKYILSGLAESTDKLTIDERFDKFSHNLNFDSACGTPQFTNYVDSFKGCLDYIFYQRDKFSVIDTLPLPSEEKLKEYVALPSKKFPSDHVSLVVDMILT